MSEVDRDRRKFVQQLAGGLLAVTAGRALAYVPAPPQKPNPQPIIDTHQHIWNLETFRLPWINPADETLHHSFLAPDYVKAVEGLTVRKAVYMEVAVDPAQRDEEAKVALKMCEHGAAFTVAAVLAGSVASDGFRDYILRFKNEPRIKGIRDPYQKGTFSDERLIAGLRLLGELGMSFDLISDPSLLPEMAKLVAKCPHTRFILDHCGNGDIHFYGQSAQEDAALTARRRAWEDGIAALTDAPNVICEKISGVVESGKPGEASAERVASIVDRCIDRFGEERVVFASNWPVVLNGATLREWVEVLMQITQRRGRAFQQKLFYDNANRFYRL